MHKGDLLGELEEDDCLAQVAQATAAAQAANAAILNNTRIAAIYELQPRFPENTYEIGDRF